LARAWRETIEEAHWPVPARANVSIIHRAAVIEAEDAINALIARLNSGRPVAVQGMAMLDRLMTDAISSPLFAPTDPGTLRRQIIRVTKALDLDGARFFSPSESDDRDTELPAGWG